MVRGRYGEFKVLVDGKMVVDGGRLAALGVLPSGRSVPRGSSGRTLHLTG